MKTRLLSRPAREFGRCKYERTGVKSQFSGSLNKTDLPRTPSSLVAEAVTPSFSATAIEVGLSVCPSVASFPARLPILFCYDWDGQSP
jgi:hypothetical protein